MGCDGWVKDVNAPIRVRLICYKCSNEIELNNPDWVQDHRDCIDRTGRIPIDVDIENFIGR